MSMQSGPDRRSKSSGPGTRDAALGTALAAVVSAHGVSPLDEPKRAVAIVADLIGDPTTSSATTIVALRAALTELAAQAAGASKADRDTVLGALTARGLPRGEAEQALDTVLDVLDIGPIESTSAFDRRWLLAAPLAAAISIGLGIALWTDDREGDAGTTTRADQPDGVTTVPTTVPVTTETSTPFTTVDVSTSISTTGPTTTEPERNGLTATFAPLREGSFTVERGWRLTPGQRELIGIVRLSPPGDETASGLHRELVPAIAGDGSAVTWDPEPTQRVNLVASFPGISLAPGEVLEIEFRAPIDPSSPLTEADLLTVFDDWRPDAEAIRSALGDSDELLEPVVTTQS